MNITILSVDIKTVPTAKGSYQTADVAYKNNSFQGKVEGKKVMSFGATKDSFSTLALAQPGESYEVTIVKNDKGYNDWVSMAKAEAGASIPAVSAPAGGKAPAATPRSTYETPEERAQRQVLIVRQSSLSSAIAMLQAAGDKKTAINVDTAILVAKQFEDYVFGKQALGPISEMSDDFPQVD